MFLHSSEMKVPARVSMLATAALFCCATAFGQMQQSSPSTPSAGASPSTGVGQQASPNTMDTSQMQPGGDPASSMTDKLFVKKAIEGSMAEIQTAQLALTKSNNDQVKKIAQMMIDNHGKLLDISKAVASKNGVDIPSGPGKKEQANYAKLQALSGPDFDKAYVKGLVKDHKSDDNDFKAESANAQMPDVKMLATRGEPMIASHLQMVEQLSKSINPGM